VKLKKESSRQTKNFVKISNITIKPYKMVNNAPETQKNALKGGKYEKM